MDTATYWKMVGRSAVKGTLSHFRQKLAAGLVMATLATIVQYALNVRSLSDTEKIVVSVLSSTTAVAIGSFIWNLIRIPAGLYIEPQRRTPLQQAYFDLVRANLENQDPQTAVVLRHLRMATSIVTGMHDAPNFPSGVGQADFMRILKALADSGVVYSQTSWDGSEYSSPLASVNPRTVWTTPPGMEAVLDDLLYHPPSIPSGRA